MAVRKMTSTLFAALAIAAGAAQATDYSQQAAWAESLINNVAAADNVYGGSSTIVSWAGVKNATKYQNQSTCAPFISNVVKTANNFTDGQYRDRTGSSSPSSSQYFQLILAQKNFSRIGKAAEIQRGDIIALEYQPCANNSSTGHTMMAMGPAVLRAAPSKPLIANTVQYEVLIADSTSSPHTTTDSNGKPYADKRTSSNGTGAGTGWFRIYADATTGNIVGYTWTMNSGSAYYDAASCRVIAVGRMQ